MTDITIFQSKKIITMNPSNPEGTHIAIKEGRILGVGSLDDVAGWGAYTLDDAFKDKVIIPGFVEAHGHVLEGIYWAFPYVGYFDRLSPDGTLCPGCKSIDEIVAALKKLDAQMEDPNQLLLAWGVDPLFFPDAYLSKTQLDAISTTRPIMIVHLSGHLATCNSALLKKENIQAGDAPGVATGEDGEPNGELQELSAMQLAKTAFNQLLQSVGDVDSIWRYGNSARNNGVTTITDLGSITTDDQTVIDLFKQTVNDADFPARLAIAYSNALSSHANIADKVNQAVSLREENSEKLRFQMVKFVIDGSNQGFTGQSLWPGYYKREDQGLWLMSPEELNDAVLAFHKAGIQVLCHCNGNAAVEMFLEAVENALNTHARFDHRHTVEHCQTATLAQFRRIKALNLCVNLFANHVYIWGDLHRDIIFGPERAAGMNACATALREGIPFSVHSDANVTPLGGLLSMWSAVNRLTASGNVLGPHERISPYDALQAVTLGAAYLLKMDDEVGSLECSKWADFAVLDESPLDVEPEAIKDIPVWGTVLAGKKFPNKANK